MTKTEQMATIAMYVSTALHETTRDNDTIRISYERPGTSADLDKYIGWDSKYNHINPGDEYFVIYDETPTGYKCLLYVLNVSCDSVLTAMAELVNLIAREF